MYFLASAGMRYTPASVVLLVSLPKAHSALLHGSSPGGLRKHWCYNGGRELTGVNEREKGQRPHALLADAALA